MTRFLVLCKLCERFEAESSKTFLVSETAEFLVKLESSREIACAVRLMLGKPLSATDSGVLNVNHSTLNDVILRISGVGDESFLKEFNKTGDFGSATKTMLGNRIGMKQDVLIPTEFTIEEIFDSIEAVSEASGHHARLKKERLIESLLGQCSPLEAKYVIKNITGEMRHGFGEGLMEAAIAKAFGVKSEKVRLAHMLVGDLGVIAGNLREHGTLALDNLDLRILQPIRPMLAEMAQDVSEAIQRHKGNSGFEFKLDGARVQIHRTGDSVKIFSRRLSDITTSLPEVVDTARSCFRAKNFVIEGEVIAIGAAGRPLPFQYLMRRYGRLKEVESAKRQMPIRIYVFDILYLDGKTLIYRPLEERRQILSEITSDLGLVVPQLVTARANEAERFFERSVSEGHEGLVAKHLHSAYTPGSRGKKWLKIKQPLGTLDLVVMGAQYGIGHRHAWLSDLYLGAINHSTHSFEMIGKTFKGLTNVEIQDMTIALKKLTIRQTGRSVYVKPEIVVEVAFSEIQSGPRYQAGFALRFARVVRVRHDKSYDEVDSMDTVDKLYRKQFEFKDRAGS
ncbi:MAG: ATP-dependent DNA ligase [Candidatus Bathyarchaeia archaeon]